MQLRQQAEQVKAVADAARHEAELRTELLRTELADLRAQLAAREEALLGLRLEGRALAERAHALEAAGGELQSRLAAAETATTEAVRQHAGDLAAERVRYEGLSKQLLRETAHQRETFQTERQRLEAELARAAERLAALESLRERLLTELAEERVARQQAAAEAAALATLVEQQRQTLARVGTTIADKQPAGTRRPVHRAARTTKKAPAATPARRTR
jgi:chromosome segregation ATPase